MRLLDRYLLRELLIPLSYCLGGLLIFYIAFDLISGLNSYQEHKLLFADIVELYIVKIPAILVLILPIVLLLALLYALTNHARHNEITAIRAAGISLWRICLPYLGVGFLLGGAVFAMNELWVPNSNDRCEEILNRHKQSSAGSSLPELSFENDRDGRLWTGGYNVDTHTIIAPKVHWRVSDGSYRWLMADRAEHLDGVWTFFGSPFFTPLDATNATALATKLKKPGRNDGVSRYLATQLSPATHYFLIHSAERTNLDMPKILTDDFNRIIQNGPLYNTRRFSGVKLSPEAKTMLEHDFEGTNLMWLNRLLLMDAYPRELSKRSSYTISVWKTTSTNTDFLILFVTNVLPAMPEFNEAPEEFKHAIEFNNRFRGASVVDSADIPIVEILAYLRRNPDLSAKRRAPLETQLYGRIAAPFTCVVVVLIAIPFGAASGRRNIFMGVAGAIVICFVYFVLLKLGLALGTGGYLPPWLAAWLPNLTFGVTGLFLMLRVR